MKSKKNAGYMVALTLFLTFGFLFLWEFWLEKLILVNYLEIEVHKNSLDRWTFIVSCLSIVSLSLILPLKSMKNTLDEINSLRTSLHSEQILSKVFFSVDNSIILVINNSNKIMQINKKTSFLLGFKEDEMLGKDWISLLIEEKSRAGLKNQYQQFIKDENQNFVRFTAAVKAKDGTEKMIDWQCSPLRDENGKIYGSINSGQDISEPIRLRGELSQLKGKYEPHIKKLTSELNFNKKKYHSEVIKSANARSRFKFWFDLENTLMGLSQEQTKNPEDIKNRIQKALKLFGKISDIDHGYVYKFTQSGSHMINTHLWVSGGPMLKPDCEEGISLDNFPWFKKNIQQKKTIHIPKIQEMPKEASPEKEVYLSQGIKSLITVPIVHNDSAVGYIGFESIQKVKKWDNDEINIIKVMARLIASITNPPSSSEPQSETEIPHSLKNSLEKPEISRTPTPEATPSIDKELRKVRESFEKEFQEKIKSMERTQSQLTSELKERKEIEADLRTNRDSIKRQLEEKSLELEKLLKESAKGHPNSPTSTQTKELEEMRNALQKKKTELATLNSQLKSKPSSLTSSEIEELKTKISNKDDEIKSLRKSFEEEKSAKTLLENKLAEVQESLTKHKKDIEILETANQVIGAELEEIKKVREENFTDIIQFENTQQELESLGIANEQLMSDIKEKSYLVEEAKERAAHYEQMDLPMFTLDQDGHILSWNNAAASLSGYISELALNQSISFMFAERDTFEFKKEFLAPLKENSKHRLEIPIIKVDGTVFKGLLCLTSFKDRNGIVTTLGYFTNLSGVNDENEIKSIKYNEKQKMALREEKLSMVERITSAVVDLVNNPIQGIGNILGQVKKQTEMADIHKGLVTVAINECRRVTDLISKLKSFQPPTKKNLESLNIHQILDEIIQNHMDTINARTITLEKKYANALPAIDCIAPQIRQAINNIIKNAEESLGEDEGKIIISTEQDGSKVKIHISDTGCGILEADMDRIFDPFYTTKSVLHRPGLGLLTSLGIVKNHKGEIDVHSKPGEGTTFTVTLPLKQSLNKNGGS